MDDGRHRENRYDLEPAPYVAATLGVTVLIKQKRFSIPLCLGLLPLAIIALSLLAPVLPLVCLAGGIAVAIWHYTTRHRPDSGRRLLPVLKVLAVLLPVGMVTVLTIVAVRTDLLRHDFEGYGSMVAFFFGMPLAFATTVVSFVALRRSRQRRFWIPLAVGLLPCVGCAILLVAAVPWLPLVPAGLAGAVWLVVVLYRHRRAKPALERRTPPPPTAAPPAPAPPPAPPEPVTAPPKAPPPPRNNKPICGIIAWILSLLAVPIALLIGWVLTHSMDTSDFKGMGAGIAIMGIMLLTVIIGVVGSLALVIASWWRRGRSRWAACRMKADESPMRRRIA